MTIKKGNTMSTKKPTADNYTVSHCTITAEAKQCSDAAAEAIAALAEASARHADAIKEMALTLRGVASSIGTGIRIGSGS
jgi:hypothetical protein